MKVLILLFFFMFVLVGSTWLYLNPGVVTLTWLDIDIQVPIGTFIGITCFSVLLIVGVTILFYKILHLRDTFATRRLKNLYSHLNDLFQKSIFAIEAGDMAALGDIHATLPRHKSLKNLKAYFSASLLRIKGESTGYQEILSELCKTPGYERLGHVLLAKHELKNRNFLAAKNIFNKLKDENPHSVIITQFYLYSCFVDEDFENALKYFEQLEKMTKISNANYYRAILLYSQAKKRSRSPEDDSVLSLLESAYYNSPFYAPLTLKLAKIYKNHNNVKKAEHVIEKSWLGIQHPDLANLYVHLVNGLTALEKSRRSKRLLDLTPNSREAKLQYGHATLNAGLWGETRRILDDMGNRLGRRGCILRAELEIREFGDIHKAKDWLNRSFQEPEDKTITDSFDSFIEKIV